MVVCSSRRGRIWSYGLFAIGCFDPITPAVEDGALNAPHPAVGDSANRLGAPELGMKRSAPAGPGDRRARRRFEQDRFGYWGSGAGTVKAYGVSFSLSV